MNYEKIKDAIKKKEIPFMQLCKQVGVTSAGLNKMLDNKKLYIHILEDISRVIGVSMSFWFRDDTEKIILQFEEKIKHLEQENRNLHDLADYQREKLKALAK